MPKKYSFWFNLQCYCVPKGEFLCKEKGGKLQSNLKEKLSFHHFTG